MTALGELVATYPYTDENGVVLYEMLRYSPKTFRARRSEADGSVTWGLDNARRVPQNLPAIVDAIKKKRAIVIVEGEKDAEALNALGFVATTNCGGANWKWTPDFTGHFGGTARIVIIVDSDAPGRKAAQERAHLLTALCEDVRVLDLAPDRVDGFDVSDWLATGKSARELKLLMSDAPRYEHRDTPESQQTPAAASGVMSFDDLLKRSSEHVDWKIEGILRTSGVLLIASRPKVGKSDLARNLAKAIATGSPFLSRRCQQGKVLWIGLEEPIQHLADRIDIMKMRDLDIAYVVDQPQGDESAWLSGVVEHHKPDLVIIDTIGRFSKIENVNDYSQVVRATQPMLDLRSRLGTTFVLLHHNNAANTTLGSTMWEGFCDSIMSLSRNGDGTRFVQTKQRSGMEMEPTTLTMDPDTGSITCVESAFIADQRVAERRILEILQAESGNTREDLAKRCGRKAYVGRAAVDSLLAAKYITAKGAGTRGDPRVFFATVSPNNRQNTSGKYISPIVDEDPEDSKKRPEESPRKSRGTLTNPTIPINPDLPGDPEESNQTGYGGDAYDDEIAANPSPDSSFDGFSARQVLG